MISWFVDNLGTITLVLGLLVFGLAVLWYMNQERRWLIALGVGIFLFVGSLGLYYLGDRWLPDTDRRQIERALEEMAAGVGAHDVNRIFANISDEFRIGGTGKQEFRKRVEQALGTGEVVSLTVWDIDPKEIARAQRKATVLFRVKGNGGGTRGEWFRCRARFVLDPDGRWRLQTFDLFQPQTDPEKGDPVQFPI